MRSVAKASLVATGYVAAIAIAWLVATVYDATAGPDRQGGMAAFGVTLVFVAAFGVAALFPTGAALFFLRARPALWVALSVMALVVASSALAACLTYLTPGAFDSSGPLRTWSMLAPVRILVAPLFALFFLLSGLLAPNRPARISLLAATTIEIVAFGCVVFMWVSSLHR